jgi:hypothetical protein
MALNYFYVSLLNVYVTDGEWTLHPSLTLGELFHTEVSLSIARCFPSNVFTQLSTLAQQAMKGKRIFH